MQDKYERLNPADKLQDYYERFDADDGYEQLLFRAGKGLQSAELNDMQAQVFNHVQGVADAILKDGDVVSGGDIVVGEDGKVTLGATKIYLRGQVRTLKPAMLTIPVDQILDIGVRFTETVVTELEAPALRDPAQGTHNYGEGGAGRLKVTCAWGLAADSNEGNFYPVYKVDNGALVVNTTPPQLDSVNVALARYDRESNGGNYVVDGMYASYREEENPGDAGKKQVFSIAEGKAHILGYEIEFPTAIRKTFPSDPDLQTIDSEIHTFTPDSEGKMRINTAFSPIYEGSQVQVKMLVRETREITRGGSSNGLLDPLLGISSLQSIESVKQNDTEYTSGVDYKKTNNQVDWTPGGTVPASGSTYTVEFLYLKTVMVSADEEGFTLSGAEAKSQVFLQYQWKMPRIDALTLDRTGVVRRVKGIPNTYTPSAPAIPENQLLLANISQKWWDKAGVTDGVTITDKAVRSVTMETLGEMQSQIADLYQLLALEKLRNNATAEESASKYGVFVDPFLDDDLRDQGLVQTAAIVDGELILPVDNINVTDIQLPDGQARITLDYELEPVIEQTLSTGQMKVNPYKAFEPLPALATLTPSVDHWVQSRTLWRSQTTRNTVNSSSTRPVRTEYYTRLASQYYTKLDYIRVQDVKFVLTGFGPGEALERVRFDGSDVEVNQ